MTQPALLPHTHEWGRYPRGMAQSNAQVAAIFQEMADLLEILGENRFRVNAFARASRAVDHLADDLASLPRDPAAIAALEGVGKGTAERIIEFLDTDAVKDHQALKARVPEGLPELLAVPGLGPKTVALLWKEAGVESMADLKARLDTDDLASIKGLGARTLANIRKNLAFAETAGDRIGLHPAMATAAWFVDRLQRIKAVRQVAFAGSLRRGCETIGDLDLLVAADDKDRAAIGKAFAAMTPVADVLLQGETKTSIRTDDGVQVDLRIVSPESFGAALAYFTGSKEHNVQLRERAIKRGMSLNEYALTRDGEVIASQTEASIHEALGLTWIPPELREARGEIALAEAGNLPALIERASIRAELHAHTTASDGRWSIRELVQATIDRGFHTVAITDHSRSQVQANGLSVERLERHIEAIREVAAEMKGVITVLAGSEVDILADGQLDYPDSLLEELDLVVASPHHALSQEPKAATRRLIKAIEHPSVTIVGHLTGRLINRRPGLSPELKPVFEAAKQRGVALEINANYMRLDLRDGHARAAVEAGVRLAINTDAHGPADLDQLTYGLLTARRAGVTADHVVNCLPHDELHQWIASTRG